MPRKERQCMVNGDRPGSRNRSINFTEAEYEKLEDEAGERGFTVSQFLREQLKPFFKI